MADMCTPLQIIRYLKEVWDDPIPYSIVKQKVVKVLNILEDKDLFQFNKIWTRVLSTLIDLLNYCSLPKAVMKELKPEVKMYVYDLLIDDEALEDAMQVKLSLFYLVTSLTDKFLVGTRAKESLYMVVENFEHLQSQSPDGELNDLHPIMYGLSAAFFNDEFENAIAELSDEVLTQAFRMKPGTSLRFVLKLLSVFEEMLYCINFKIRTDDYSHLDSQLEVANKFLIFFNSSKIAKAWQLPGMADEFARILINITDHLCSMDVLITNDFVGEIYKECLKSLGDIYSFCLENYGGELSHSVIRSIMVNYGGKYHDLYAEFRFTEVFFFLYLPLLKDRTYKNVPPEFIDPISKRFMVYPLKLDQTHLNIIVDASTVLQLKIKKRNNPFNNQPITSYSYDKPFHEQIRQYVQQRNN